MSFTHFSPPLYTRYYSAILLEYSPAMGNRGPPAITPITPSAIELGSGAALALDADKGKYDEHGKDAEQRMEERKQAHQNLSWTTFAKQISAQRSFWMYVTVWG